MTAHRALPAAKAQKMGFSKDRRKRRSQHRQAARRLIDSGTLLNTKAPRGSTPHAIAAWHLAQARWLR